MPSNPEQLLGAILVRKDIFYRFEMTMNDTCLDANSLLEYLFSLYNSTAAPSERDNFPSPQSFGLMHRDLNLNKKGTRRRHHVFPLQSNIINSQFPQSTIHDRLLDSSRSHQSGAIDRHRKKIKIDQSNFEGGPNYAAQHQGYNGPVSLKLLNSHPVIASHNPSASLKAELTPDVESRHAHSSSPLPPFSQIRHHNSKPYSPVLAHYSDALTTPPLEDSQQNLGHSASVDTSGDVKLEIEGALHGVLENQNTSKNAQGSSKRKKKLKLKGSNTQTNYNNGRSGDHTGRRKRMHQCFCGALFTRADNLKRHIRKCHEEKLEKLSSVPLGFDSDNNNVPVADFSQEFPSSGQEASDHIQPQDSQQQPHQQHESLHQQQHQDDSVIKSVTAEVKWSCFCGESFGDHHQLVEHSRIHDSPTRQHHMTPTHDIDTNT